MCMGVHKAGQDDIAPRVNLAGAAGQRVALDRIGRSDGYNLPAVQEHSAVADYPQPGKLPPAPGALGAAQRQQLPAMGDQKWTSIHFWLTDR